MTHRLILLAFFASIFFSCKKDKLSDDADPQEQGVDTLSAGWSKTDAPKYLYPDIFFASKDIGYLISNYKILTSANGGTLWSEVATVGENLLNIAASISGKAIFVSGTNKLYFTNDRVAIDSIVLEDQGLSDAFFVSKSTAYAIGNKLWKTTDEGFTWIQLHDFGIRRDYRTLFFLNELTGFVSADNRLYKTIDGGSTWKNVSDNNIAFLSFPNATEGYAASLSSILKTSDGGETWQPVNIKNTRFRDLHFFNASVGFAIRGNEVHKTNDGGNLWNRVVKMGNIQEYLIELHFIDENHGWACGGNGTVLRYVK